MRGKWLLFAGVVILAGIGAGALSLLRRPSPPAQPAKAPAPMLGTEISFTGKVQARHVVPVPATTDGTIEEFMVEIGHDVYEGQLLARIRNTNLETSVDRAQLEFDRAQSRAANLDGALIAARLEAARADADSTRARQDYEKVEKAYLRQQLLHKEGATPRLVFERTQKDFLAIKSEYESVRDVAGHADDRVQSLVKEIDAARRTLEEKNEELEQAKEDLLATEVHSPVDGILVARRGEVGGEINQTIQDLFQIAVDLSSLDVVVEPEPPALARVHPGQTAIVRLAETANEPIPGAVREIKGSQVIVEFTNPSPAIRPGLTAQVTIKIG